MEQNDLLREMLNAGERRSKARSVVCEVMDSSTELLDAHQIHALAREKDPRISLSAVYRCLNVLEQHGLVTKRDLIGSLTHFVCSTQEQKNCLVDIKSGKVTQVKCRDLQRTIQKTARRMGYSLQSYRLELYGYPLKNLQL